jgi:nucleoid-associated protein YgaU
MKSRLSMLLLITVVGVALIASSGCCRKPPKEVGEAEAAVAQAEGACAKEYAPEDYQKAYDKLSMAQKLATDRKCKDSRKAALEAIDLAAAAEKRAGEREAELNAEADGLIAAAEAEIQKAKTAYADLERKKNTVAQERNEALQVAKDKDFAKFDVKMDLPEPKVDPTPMNLVSTAEGILAEAKTMRAEGKCNLLDVIAKLKTIDLSKVMGLIADNSKALDKLSALIQETLKIKTVEWMDKQPKFWEHDVVKGECLWKIAANPDYYNDPFKWPLIWWSNQWTEEKVQGLTKEQTFNLIKDPDLIFPGQHFKFSMKPEAADAENAIHYAKNRYGLTDWRDIPDFLTDGK